jgi:hypothetical protein
MKNINLGLAFALEIAMLGALFYWGFTREGTLLYRIVLAMATPSAAALIWSTFMAPKSSRRFKGAAYLILKAVLFGWAALALWAAGQPIVAAIFIVLAILNQILLIMLGGHIETLPE